MDTYMLNCDSNSPMEYTRLEHIHINTLHTEALTIPKPLFIRVIRSYKYVELPLEAFLIDSHLTNKGTGKALYSTISSIAGSGIYSFNSGCFITCPYRTK